MPLRPLVCALLCVAFTARADAPPEPDAARVYVGRGQILTVSVPRQLSLNAHVSQVLVQPGSLEAAYTGAIDNGDTVTTFVRLVGFQHGETQTLFTYTGPLNFMDLPDDYQLVGWSEGGRYLIVGHRDIVTGADSSPDDLGYVWDSVDVGVLPPKVRRVSLPADTPDGGSIIGGMLPSPSGKLFAVQYRDVIQADPLSANPANKYAHPGVSYAFFYDPYKDSVRRLPLPAGSLVRGWTDDAHLLVLTHPSTTRQYVSFDIVTGKVTPFRPAPPLLGAGGAFAPARPSPVSRRFPEVSLWLLERSVLLPAPGDRTTADARALWLSIKGARPKLVPVCLGVALGTDSLNALLVPDGSAALWVANGDLYVSTFHLDAATVREKYDAGDALSCDEERGIAEDNAKQIGLGLLQYSQDYDEQFPPAANFHDGVYPYIKNESIFHEGTHPFTYAAPANLHLSAMDAPADTVLGTIHLPCATVTLHADGHVTSEPPAPPGTMAP